MGDRETPRMRKYGESKRTGIMMATVRHVTYSSGLRKFQADGFLFDWLYEEWWSCIRGSSNLKMAAAGSSETLVTFCTNTRHHVLEDRNSQWFMCFMYWFVLLIKHCFVLILSVVLEHQLTGMSASNNSKLKQQIWSDFVISILTNVY